jgi:hypothetical protein
MSEATPPEDDWAWYRHLHAECISAFEECVDTLPTCNYDNGCEDEGCLLCYIRPLLARISDPITWLPCDESHELMRILSDYSPDDAAVTRLEVCHDKVAAYGADLMQDW